MKLSIYYEKKFWTWYLAKYCNAELGQVTYAQLQSFSTYVEFQYKTDTEKCALYKEFLEYHRIFAYANPAIIQGEVKFECKLQVVKDVDGHLQLDEIAAGRDFISSLQAEMHAIDQLQVLIPNLAY
jgi:hypothetical protein